MQRSVKNLLLIFSFVLSLLVFLLAFQNYPFVYALPFCSDSDGGFFLSIQGTTTGQSTLSSRSSSRMDYCRTPTVLREYFCNALGLRTSAYVSCPNEQLCTNGACPLDSDGDGIFDADDTCPDYDDTENFDEDDLPDGCDSDDDNDGYNDDEEIAGGTDPLDGSSYPCSLLYDDFSATTLNMSLWTVSPDIGSAVTGYVDQYYLDSVAENYHTAQLAAAGSDRGVLLQLTRPFVAGEVLSYDVFYENRGGNFLHRLYLDGTYLEYLIGANTTSATSGNIGYWNGPSEVGDVFGTYHVTVSFGANSTSFVIIRPDLTTWTYTASGLVSPHTYGVATRAGNNGYGEFDYDTFAINC